MGPLIPAPSLSLLAQALRMWSANAGTAELGLPVITAPDVIAAFLRRRGRRVVFATH